MRLELAIAASCLALTATPASAQIVLDGGNGANLDVETFEPKPLGFPGIGRARNLRWGEWAVGGFVSYANSPLVLFEGRLQVGEVVRNRLSVDLVGGLGLTEWLEVQAALPFTVWQSGDDGLPTGDLATAGLRDVRLAAKITLLTQYRGGAPLGLAIRPEVQLPTGDDDAFLGAGSLRFTPSAIVERTFDLLWGLHFAGSVGLNLRPDANVGNIDVRDELNLRLGAGLGLPNWLGGRPILFAEIATATRLDAPFSEPELNPFVGRFGLRFEKGTSYRDRLHGTGGFGAGTTRGYGAPDAQVFAGLVWERRLGDRDGDGILDRDDACPDEPEDFDGFEDEDGCPDFDRDRDGIPDDLDACPDDPEDLDGFQDEDGCPDPDNDRDEVPDVEDGCPNEPEDFDGFDDDDGCPEEDSDRDGVPDDVDECPEEKETINGIDDEDGCPDEGEPQVEVTTEKVTIDSRIEFDFNSDRIRKESFSILDQVALTLKANPQLAKVRVEGHTDDRGSEAYNQRLSQARAESVVRYLVSKGVSKARLEARGFGESLPRVPGTGEQVWAKNRRVEFTVLERGSDDSADAQGTSD
ncbi:MAG: OmpA family protein [Myxococcota bacterium]